jgi:glycopeptide antibiotics resistance protein
MSIWLILTISFFVSFFIETSQYLFYKGVTQFDDVLHNVLGCWLGVLVSKIKVRTV